MGRIEYDHFEGLRRLGEARAKLDDRAGAVLTFHAALEREIDFVLARLMPRPDKLRGLGFGQKVSVLAAAWRGTPESGDMICAALLRLNELRNSIAHGDERRVVDRHEELLAQAFAEIFPDHRDVRDVEIIAAGLVGFLADGPIALEKLRIGAGDERGIAREAGAAADE